jgi:hypothetical protein
VEIRREWNHIDILIVHPKFVVAIENKVDSQDHSNQLSRYQKVVEKYFPNLNKNYVYLTPNGDVPIHEESRVIYINYSYRKLSIALERILDVYKDSLSVKVFYYLQDYLTIIRRELMMADELNKDAVKIYNAHRDALDFIYKNRPDPASELYEYFANKIKESNWEVGSKGRGWIGFLTPKLNEILPRGYNIHWPKKESFLFALNYQKENLFFETNIPPMENDEIRRILRAALESVKGHRAPGDKQWLIHFRSRFEFRPADLINETEDNIKQAVDKIWPEIDEIVLNVEAAILAREKELKMIPPITSAQNMDEIPAPAVEPLSGQDKNKEELSGKLK